MTTTTPPAPSNDRLRELRDHWKKLIDDTRAAAEDAANKSGETRSVGFAAAFEPYELLAVFDELLALRASRERPVADAGERDARIAAWHKSATCDPCKPPGAYGDTYPAGYWLAASEIDEALALMRSAPPAATDAALREAAQAVVLWMRASTQDQYDAAYAAAGIVRNSSRNTHAVWADFLEQALAASPPAKDASEVEDANECIAQCRELLGKQKGGGLKNSESLLSWVRATLDERDALCADLAARTQERDETRFLLDDLKTVTVPMLEANVHDARQQLAAAQATAHPAAELRGLLTFAALRHANLARLPEFKNAKGEPAHSEPDGSDWLLSQWSNACLGELGEAANIIKKIERGDLSLDEARDKLADEFCDVVTYLDILAYRAGVNLADATVSKWNRISERIGSKIRLAALASESAPGGESDAPSDLPVDLALELCKACLAMRADWSESSEAVRNTMWRRMSNASVALWDIIGPCAKPQPAREPGGDPAADLPRKLHEQLGSFWIHGPVWDGDVICKSHRDALVDLGLVDRFNGWQFLNKQGVAVALKLFGNPSDTKRKQRYVTKALTGEWPAPQPVEPPGAEAAAPTPETFKFYWQTIEECHRLLTESGFEHPTWTLVDRLRKFLAERYADSEHAEPPLPAAVERAVPRVVWQGDWSGSLCRAVAVEDRREGRTTRFEVATSDAMGDGQWVEATKETHLSIASRALALLPEWSPAAEAQSARRAGT